MVFLRGREALMNALVGARHGMLGRIRPAPWTHPHYMDHVWTVGLQQDVRTANSLPPQASVLETRLVVRSEACRHQAKRWTGKYRNERRAMLRSYPHSSALKRCPLILPSCEPVWEESVAYAFPSQTGTSANASC